MLDVFKQKVDDLKAEYNNRLGQKNVIETNIVSLQSDIDGQEISRNNNIKMIMLLQQAAQLSRGNIKQHLESICTMALKFVFDKDIEFVIDIEESRGRPEAEFYIQYSDSNGDLIKVKPEDASGGGVIDVLSTALRFAFLELLDDPKIQGPILLDEPGKMISEVAATRMALLLKEFEKRFDRQIIMSTHNNAYKSVASKELTVSMSGVSSKIAENVPVNLSVDDIVDTELDQVELQIRGGRYA